MQLWSTWSNLINKLTMIRVCLFHLRMSKLMTRRWSNDWNKSSYPQNTFDSGSFQEPKYVYDQSISCEPNADADTFMLWKKLFSEVSNDVLNRNWFAFRTTIESASPYTLTLWIIYCHLDKSCIRLAPQLICFFLTQYLNIMVATRISILISW